MRTSVLIAACCFAFVAASSEYYQKKVADKSYLEKQQKVLQLFVGLNQPQYNAEMAQIGQSYNPKNNVQDYTNTRAIKEFIKQLEKGFLDFNEPFSVINSQISDQITKVFDLFYFAKDFDTFYKSACYARQHMNPDMFSYALRAAVLLRPDTRGLQVPPLTDINPYFYVYSQVIKQAQQYKQQGKRQAVFYSNYSSYQQQYQDEYDHHSYNNENPHYPFHYESPQQYTNYYNQYNQENQLSYFTDDVQLNKFNAYFFMMHPSFFNSQKYGMKNQNEDFGEEFYYYLQQFLARYNLERLSNNFPAVKPIQFNQPIKPGYNPNLQRRNGQNIPLRPENIQFKNANAYDLMHLKDVERRLQEAADSEYVIAADGSKVPLTAENGMDILGKAVAGNSESINRQYYSVNNGHNGYMGYFWMFLKTMGNIVDPYNQYGAAPGSLNTMNTAAKDPVFYQILARVVKIFQNFKNKIQPYTTEQLYFPEAKVQSVEVDQLYTYYDTKDVDLYGALYYKQGEQAENFEYKARQYQLNYKPYNYRIHVQSAKNSPAVVRVFIGPKYNVNGQQYTLEQARKYFVEFDRFVVELKNGENKIERSSKSSHIFVEDQPNTRELFRQVKQAWEGAQQFYFYENPNYYGGFPQNLALPRGSKAGQEFTFFVIVNQYQPNPNNQDQSFYPNVDNRPFGFPFDRRVNEEYFENAPNAYFQSIKVYHKYNNEVNKQQ